MENDIQIKITQITKIFKTMINKIKNMNKNGEQHIYQNNKNYKTVGKNEKRIQKQKPVKMPNKKFPESHPNLGK